MSVGAAIFPRDGKTIDELLAADRDLYGEKGSGLGRIPSGLPVTRAQRGSVELVRSSMSALAI